MHNVYKTERGILTASPAALLFLLGYHLSATAVQPCSQKAMGKLQAVACCQLIHHSREHVTPCPWFLSGHVSPKKIMPIAPSRPNTIDYLTEFPQCLTALTVLEFTL